MNTLLYCLISILVYVLINKYIYHKYKKHECEHRYKTVFTETSDNIPLNYSFALPEGSKSPIASKVYVAFERCMKCGYERVIMSSGIRIEFKFDQDIYVAYCRDIEKKYELKKELNL